jgi:hypothetical protein
MQLNFNYDSTLLLSKQKTMTRFGYRLIDAKTYFFIFSAFYPMWIRNQRLQPLTPEADLTNNLQVWKVQDRGKLQLGPPK